MKKNQRTKNDLKVAALRLLNMRDRSAGELAEQLEKDFPAEEVAELITHFQKIGYLDDLRYAQNYVQARNRFRPRGNYLLRMELKNKGVADSLIKAVLNTKEDEYELALALGRRRTGRLGKISKQARLRRLGSYLQRRGFPAAVVQRVVRELLDSDL